MKYARYVLIGTLLALFPADSFAGPKGAAQRPADALAKLPATLRPNASNRPNIAPRPANPAANRPNINLDGINRPNIAPGPANPAVNRPNINLGGVNRPNLNLGNVNRPNVGAINRPNVGAITRPNLNLGNVSRPQLNVGSGNARPNLNLGGGIVNRSPINVGGGNVNRGPINIGGGGNVNRGPINVGSVNVNRPTIGVGNRANTNVGIGGGFGPASAYRDRPFGGNTTNHANIGIGNRPLIGSNNRINVNRTEVNRNTLVNNRVNIARSNGGVYRPGYSHYHGNYSNWHNGYWNNWNYQPWLGGGFGNGLLLGGAVAYSNPYYDVPPVDVVPVFDYSQPIPVPEPFPVYDPAVEYGYSEEVLPAEQPPAAPADDKAAVATRLLDLARDAFRQNEYARALEAIDKAVGLLPSDATLHEFRALVLYARGQYNEAASVIHSVLAVGPGWDWNTMRALYPDGDTYTRQMRALEEHCRGDKNDSAARFLLVYHYLVIDSRDAAILVLRDVVALQPKDELAAQLLKSLQQPAQAPMP